MQAALGDSKRASRVGGREGGKEGITRHGTRLVERDASSCLRVCTRTDNRPAQLSSEALEDGRSARLSRPRTFPSRSDARKLEAFLYSYSTARSSKSARSPSIDTCTVANTTIVVVAAAAAAAAAPAELRAGQPRPELTLQTLSPSSLCRIHHSIRPDPPGAAIRRRARPIHSFSSVQPASRPTSLYPDRRPTPR
ncbi:hypothetical protein HETIRDRAFT_448178 [Heterobasidion irregulare TC 32-1]|uniref:Uncharacterized protein n=1 Tax=Heterobasidion irregulare (strain TC 32-1) TaxID=747525 RepID=W4KPG1_HETIT|nr:uncharacterized protein HETIRDRAFT_448178 [Heterobasidion irregulare TC 32-1]ETW87733.1 hypothetical protein HETIRDRAFT_448178 [Heterobasidion irregulare TC 32-1]